MQARTLAGPRRRLAVGLVVLVLAPAVARGADPTLPTPAARAAWWIERLVAGPEPTTWGIPNFHQNLLLDAERNLVLLGGSTLDALADPALQSRVQGSRDANAWHSLLAVLVPLGPGRPDVARAWAVPALRHSLLTLRRAALPVLAALGDPTDGPLLLEVLRRDAADRVLGPAAAEALLRLGAPFDAAAVRLIHERVAVDQPDGSSALWALWPSLASKGRGTLRDDVLAWWALLAETSGPRAADASRGGGRAGRRIDPDGLDAVPLPHAMTRGRDAAALARSRLAASGHAPARAAVAEDLASGDAALVQAARQGLRAEGTEAEHARERDAAAAALAALRAGRPVEPGAVRAHVAALRDDPSADATLLLDDLLRAFPPTPAWRDPITDAYDALAARGQEDAAYAEGHLRAGTPEGTDLALWLARHAKSRALLEALERWHEEPASLSIRPRLRREIAYLYGFWAPRDVLPPERVEAFASRLASWVVDPSDPSGVALAGTLTELGAAGERAFAAGLRGPARAAYVGSLGQRPSRYLSADLVAALVEPVGPATPAVERRRTLEAVLLVAGPDALPSLDSLAARLPPDARADVDVVRGIVRWRVPSEAGR